MGSDAAYCPTCQTETAVRVKPVFQGFEKVGEERLCTFCGEKLGPKGSTQKSASSKPKTPGIADLFAEPYTPAKPVNPFGDEPIEALKAVNPFGGPVVLPKAVNPFGDSSEPLRLCRHCKHYVVNPFQQKCMLHKRDVTATDTCPEFTAKPV